MLLCYEDVGISFGFCMPACLRAFALSLRARIQWPHGWLFCRVYVVFMEYFCMGVVVCVL